MTTRYANSILFRELTHFGDKSSDEWNGNGYKWIKSEYGKKIAVVDLVNKLIHLLSDAHTAEGADQVATVKSQAAASLG
jgi:hypothetical protein